MALLKNKPANFGLEITYWSIDELNINYASKQSHCVLFGYLSEDSKKEDKEKPVETISFDWSGEDFTFVKGVNNIEIAYEKIKETEEFKDSIDC